MSDERIVGVDFSGAKEVPNETWIAVGELGQLGLNIVDVTKTGSHRIAAELAGRMPVKAAGFDFPFSLPADFLSFLFEKLSATKNLTGSGFQSWQEVAEQLAFMSFDDFLALVVEFGKEPKRITDKICSRTAISPLHRGNPSMVQMTFQGMRFLASLDPAKFFVLPFQDKKPDGCAVMEVYPRETLRALGVTDSGYKSKEKKDREKVLAVRKQIIADLVQIRERKGESARVLPRLALDKKLEHVVLDSDHALDAVIACYTAAIWLAAPQVFQDPFSQDSLDVLLEGWLYGPCLEPQAV